MEIVTRAKCWKCEKPFTVSFEEGEMESSFNKAARVMDCLYCGAQCRVVVGANQAPSGIAFRGTGEASFKNISPEPFKEMIFESFPVEEEAAAKGDGQDP